MSGLSVFVHLFQAPKEVELRNSISLSTRIISKYYRNSVIEGIPWLSIHVWASYWECTSWPSGPILLGMSLPPSQEGSLASTLPLPCSTFHSHFFAHSLSASKGSRKFGWPKLDRDKCFITRRPQCMIVKWSPNLECHTGSAPLGEHLTGPNCIC